MQETHFENCKPKFKYGDDVVVVNQDSPHVRRKAVLCSYNTDCSGDRRCHVVFSDGRSYYCYESSLELIETNPPFNLEQFKSGIPAITRDGRVAEFVNQNAGSILVNIEGVERWLHSNGMNYLTIPTEPTDLVYMQVAQSTPEQSITAQKPSKSLDEKRYEWFKQYLMSHLTIDSLENETVDCKSSQEFDAVIDKYSAKISFNKD